MNNLDRELLELAIAAAGMNVCSIQNEKFNCYGLDGKHNFHWNPLTNDSDALRLAVKLRLSIESDVLIEVGYTAGIGGEYEYGCEVWIVHPDATTTKAQQLYNDDPDAATRRAIVLVAAQIGAKL